MAKRSTPAMTAACTPTLEVKKYTVVVVDGMVMLDTTASTS